MIVRIASRCSYARAAPDAFAILSRYGRFYEESEREREGGGRKLAKSRFYGTDGTGGRVSWGDSCRWATPLCQRSTPYCLHSHDRQGTITELVPR